MPAKPVEILLYSEIYPDSAKDYLDQIRAAGSAPIKLRISCPGGDCFAGNAIYNALLQHKPGVTVTIDGVAASMATIIMLAGSKISMAENAMLMIHNPSGGAWGNAEELEGMAELLRKLEASFLNAYMKRVGDRVSREDFAALLEKDTWLDANAALSLGLVDEITTPSDLQACIRFDTARLRNAPVALLNAIAKPMKFTLTASLVAALPAAFTAVGLADPKITEATSEADFLAHLNALSAAGTKFKAALDAATAQLGTLTTERDTLQAQFTTLEGTVTALKTERDTAKGQVTALTTELTTAKEKNSAHERNIERISGLCRARGLDISAAPPTLGDPAADTKKLTMAQFDALTPKARMEFVNSGGAIL